MAGVVMPAPAPDDDERQHQDSRAQPLPEASEDQSAESCCEVTLYQCVERSVFSQNHGADPCSDPERKCQGQKQQTRANRRQPPQTLKRQAQHKDEPIDRQIVE
jgi:hypothetical protein